ncbi:DnaB-like helicase C-terminal domain-containing protein [Mycoplasmopsis gallinacea]|uniref:AAA family ATPase n=1 Tax=Mycoplasmopsis gallinacea TaxID=29556 RepID=A0A6H0V4W8_9BACT|nr:DnaB-like helicase C-terminal domain-containing protein [Mycoplasmopsis gallinacea]QIW62516.1 AAA family ATPase [Mycoplasmopsis gallinacea]
MTNIETIENTEFFKLEKTTETEKDKSENNKFKTLFCDNTIKEMLNNKIENIDSNGIKTNFSALDSNTKGLTNKHLYVLAGRSGTGKTTLMINLINNIMKEINQNTNDVVLFISLEVPANEIAQKFVNLHFKNKVLDNYSKDELIDLKNKWFNEEHQNKTFLRYLKNLIILDNYNLYASELINLINEMKKENMNVRALFIDHLQIFKYSLQQLGKREEINKIMLELKNIAKYFNIPVVALSQLSRPSKSDSIEKDCFNVPKPKLTDLKESSSIEETADVVALLYTANVLSDDTEILHLSIDKNRNGKKAVERLGFDKKFSRIVSIGEDFGQWE